MTLAPPVLAAPDASSVVGRSASAVVPAAEVSRLQALVLTGERTTSAAAAGVEAAVELARLYHAQGDRNAAESIWRRGLALFARAALPADGGAAATAAAEARFRLAEPEAVRLLMTQFALDPAQPPARQLVDLQRRLEAWLLQATGAKAASGRGAGAASGTGSAGGIQGALAAVEALQAPIWTRQAAVLVARVLAQPAQALGAVAVPAGSPPAAVTAHQDVWLPRAKALRDQGFASLERAWKQAERDGARDDTVDRVRKALHAYDPAQYPLAEAVTAATAAEPPGRAEAARLAGLAQQADKPSLKVMYLQKAVKLDPTHEQWQGMLRAAEAELARSR